MPRGPRAFRPAALAALVVALIAGWFALERVREPSAPPPARSEARNLLLISIDTLRADRLGTYGYSRPTSPNLDALAARSIVFRDVLAQAPTTSPSHHSIFSGLYVFQHRNSLADTPVMAELLADHGFRTAAFVDGGQLRRKFGLDKGFETYFDAGRLSGRGSRLGGGLHVLNPRLIAWLEDHREEPFFAFLQTYDVHCPYKPPEPYFSMFTDGFKPGFKIGKKCGARHFDKLRLGPADFEYIGALYDGGVRYADAKIGELLSALDRLGLAGNTIVIVTSDHGESLGERSRIGHNRVYDVQLKIPLILHIPGGVHRRVDQPVQSIDILPTVLALFGVDAPSLPGEDLMPLVSRPHEIRPRVRFAETLVEPQQTVRIDGRWSLILQRNAAPRLYDLVSDPTEEANVIKSEPEIARRALAAYQQLGVGDDPIPVYRDDLDAETEAQLRALGYAP